MTWNTEYSISVRMITMNPPKTFYTFFSTAFFICLLYLVSEAQVQPKTDPSEVAALNPIFSNWQDHSPFFSIKWSAGDDLCNSSATISTIKCNCSIGNGTTCHITQLNATDMEIDWRIPEGIQSLSKLEILNLHGNYFSGPLPTFVGNLTELQYLDLGSNVLNGTIPRELGKLKKLTYLDIGINNFTGSLPEELGNLTNLQDLRLNSIRVTGQIPPTFLQLNKLQTLWISDNDFTGNIPAFNGNFAVLTDLRLQGNSFQGPIPSSFADLNLTQLRIGEVNGSSALLNITKMKYLEILVLRNSNISGNIPDDFEQNTKLKHLDLSFNSLTGHVPQSLFNMASLEYLSLANNHLSGPLPSTRNSSQYVDLSYNDFFGSFPDWVNDSYNLNLVGNNFTDDPSKLFQLACLQKGFPCSRSPPVSSRFGVNCGGSKPVNASNGLYYDADSASLEEIPYFVSSDSKWAVASGGKFFDVLGPTYIQSIQSVFEGTQDPDLFLDMRLSASSLRYYGLGLENKNYTVTLDFGETQDYWDTRKGRRLFDIYIQGHRVQQNYDITANAHGAPKTAVQVISPAVVTDNTLEIHIFWAGKGTCCIPNRMSYGPSISALSVVSPGSPAVLTKAKSKAPYIAGISAAVVFLLLMLTIGFFIWRSKHRLTDDEEFRALTIKPKLFSYEELKTATGDFNEANKLGHGGFGSVFKGTLSDGSEVAIKQLAISSAEGKMQFITEVATVSTVQHRNLVKLLGCCCEGDRRLLVYEYLVNKSVDKVLFGKTRLHLDWAARFKICLGTARGLAYLHEESSVRIIHRDVKSSNILLDADLNPKISDFGLAKPYDQKMSHISTRVAGTVGYLAPEYAMRGQLTEKADVFGFGIVAFEILCGRPNTEEHLGTEKIYLLDWAWKLHGENRDLEMIDQTLQSYNQEEALRVMKVAFMCTQAAAYKRPTMSRVVAMLVGDLETVEVLSKPSYLLDWRSSEPSSSQMMTTIQEGR